MRGAQEVPNCPKKYCAITSYLYFHFVELAAAADQPGHVVLGQTCPNVLHAFVEVASLARIAARRRYTCAECRSSIT